MRSTVLGSITDIDPARWNRIVAKNRVVCRHEYLRAIEESQINDCRYFYPIIWDGERIAAHACAYFISTELDAFARGILKKFVIKARQAWDSFLVLRSIECGTPVALGNTISFASGCDRSAALRQIVFEIERLAGELGVGTVLFRDFLDSELTFLNEQFYGAGYRYIHNLPTAHVAVRWRSFEEYLHAMRHPYRRKIRRRMDCFRRSGGTIEFVTDFSRLSSKLARLWRNAYEHATEYRREVLEEAFFESIDRCLDARSCVLVATLRKRLVGFALVLENDDELIWMFCGLDYRYSTDCCVYFNMIYRLIEFAIDRQFRSIDMGITTMIPKLDVGGECVRLTMYMKHLNPVLNRVVPCLFRFMTPKQEYPSRRVFRTQAVGQVPSGKHAASNQEKELHLSR